MSGGGTQHTWTAGGPCSWCQLRREHRLPTPSHHVRRCSAGPPCIFSLPPRHERGRRDESRKMRRPRRHTISFTICRHRFVQGCEPSISVFFVTPSTVIRARLHVLRGKMNSRWHRVKAEEDVPNTSSSAASCSVLRSPGLERHGDFFYIRGSTVAIMRLIFPPSPGTSQPSEPLFHLHQALSFRLSSSFPHF